jgi:hypothetical protein
MMAAGSTTTSAVWLSRRARMLAILRSLLHSAVDGKYTSSFSGQTDLTYTSGSPYTPYNQLTQEQVVGWVLGACGPDQTKENQSKLDESINLQKKSSYSGSSSSLEYSNRFNTKD